MSILSTSTLMHDNVVNPQGENLGDIKDFMIDTDDGRIVYAVLSFGGLWGLGDKLFAVPVQVLHLDPERRECILHESRERLEDAPGFDKDDWPDSTHESWLGIVRRFYALTGDDS